jgi:DNA-binding CsgD family transcriptional regulator
MTQDAVAESRLGLPTVTRLRAAFSRLKAPMLLVDDRRRCVAGNAPACEILQSTQEDLPWRSLDEFAPPGPGGHPVIRDQWVDLMAIGALEGSYELQRLDGTRVLVEYTATANVLPSRHLIVFMPQDQELVPQADVVEARATTWRPVGLEVEARPQLTEREREVLTLVAGGLRSAEIAERLFLAPETVKSHVSNAMRKLGSHTRAGAVTIALVTGQISWDI